MAEAIVSNEMVRTAPFDRPKTVIQVCLPWSWSDSMSRRLLTHRTVTATKPSAHPPQTPESETVPDRANIVPQVATRPKKTKTNTSPRQR